MATRDEPGLAVVGDHDHHAETGNDHAPSGSADTTTTMTSPSPPAIPTQPTTEVTGTSSQPAEESHERPHAPAVSHESPTGDANANANEVTATVIVEAAPTTAAATPAAAAAAAQSTDTPAMNVSSEGTPAPMQCAEQATASAPTATVAATTTTTTAEAESSKGIKEVAELGPSLTITLLLITGARHQFKIDGNYLKRRSVNVENQDPFSMSVYTLKELIWREWRSEWEPRPTSPSSIRLISFGKLLDDKSPLSDSRFSRDAPNVVHMTVKPQEVVEEEDAKGGKSHYTREREASERSPGCRCIVL